eukprot:scaffold34890_cov54-Phaeocystis_antarctica.AAC.1
MGTSTAACARRSTARRRCASTTTPTGTASTSSARSGSSLRCGRHRPPAPPPLRRPSRPPRYRVKRTTAHRLHVCVAQVDEAEFERLVEADAFEEELSGSDSDGEAEEGEEGGGAPVEGRARLMLRDATGAHLLLWRAVLGGQMFGAAGAANI